MTPRVGDLVEVRRPRLPSRIGRLEKEGSRAYVRLPRSRKAKRYAWSSLEVLVRTGVRLEQE